MHADGTGEAAETGAQAMRPLQGRILRGLAVLPAAAGVLLVFLAAVRRDVPAVRIGALSPEMNLSIVRLCGRAVCDARLPSDGRAVFELDDGSGAITVTSGRAQADILKAENRLPRRGDRVELTGCVSLRAGRNPEIYLISSGAFEATRGPAPKAKRTRMRLEEITAGQAGLLVETAGRVRAVSVPRPGSNAPYVLTLEENGAHLAVVLRGRVLQEPGGDLPLPGAELCVAGRVEIYQGQVQINVRDAGGLRIGSAHP